MRNASHIIETDAETSLRNLLAALDGYETRIEEERPEVALRGRPFKRLDYYTEEDAGIFYGREAETQQLISSILAHQLLVLVGASGTGKTSLLLAGAKPALERGECQVAYTRVMGDPLADLRRSIERAVGAPLGPGPSAGLRTGSLRDQLSALEAGQDLVIFLDQFEEFFRPKFGRAVQQSFVLPSVERLSLSIGGGPFSDERVQKAVGLAVNWAALRDEIGEVVLADFLSGDDVVGPTEAVYNPDQAKELLAEAGYPDGFDAMLLFDRDDELAVRLAELVTGYLYVVGINPKYLLVAAADARTKFATMIAAGESGLLIERR